MSRPLRVGLVGCGVISGTYLANNARFDGFDIVACTDAYPARASARARAYGIDALPFDRLLADSDIDCVLDLTPPAAHFEIGIAAIRAGKHLYQEKPLAIELEDGRLLLREAAAANVRVGCAPDTFLGGGLQTARGLLDQGEIGEPVGMALTMLNGGPERWHPDPAFFYARGAGPLFDVGPYHVTAAVSLLGPVARVVGAARMLTSTRTIATGPRVGEQFGVDVETTVHALLEHESGPIVSLVTSFDAPGRAIVPLELCGTEGTLYGLDPNEFGGTLSVRRGTDEVESVPLLVGLPDDDARGIGLDDMARAIAIDRPHRATGELALHVLEVMHAVLTSATAGVRVTVSSRVDRPAPLLGGQELGHGTE